MPGVNTYKDGVVGRLYKGLQGLVKSRKITYVEGIGRLVGPTTVEVDGTALRGPQRRARDRLGAQVPARPRHRRRAGHHQRPRPDPRARADVGGRARRRRHRLRVRQRLAVVRRRGDHRRGTAPPGAARGRGRSKGLERAFRKRGIGFELGARFSGVEQTETGVRVSLENGKSIEADLLLVAVGRGPVSQGLGYEEAGVEMDRGFVKVDECCQTNVPDVFAVGDLIPTLQLAHVGFGEGILVAEQIAGLNPAPIDYDGVPRVTYCDPEVASVGLTEARRKEKYGEDASSR